MPKLTIYKDSNSQKEVIFSNALTIGRNKGNDIVLKSTEVSDFHASIFQNEYGKHILCDQSSQNNTTVGGQKIQHYMLSHGKSFQIAEFLFTYSEDHAADRIEPKVRISRKLTLTQEIERDTQTLLSATHKVFKDPKAYRDPGKRLSLILSLASEIIAILDHRELTEKALDISMEIMDAKRGFIALKNESGKLIYSGLKGFAADSGKLRISSTMLRKVMNEGHSILTANAVTEDTYKRAKSVLTYKLKSVLCVPLKLRKEVLGCIYLDNPEKEGSFEIHDLEFLTILAHQIAIAFENARLHKQVLEETKSLKSRLRLSRNFIVNGPKMTKLYSDIKKIAKSNLSILILGETGTGKQMVARAAHDLSGRSGKFIELNCSAIPANLLESELFGHEKGAFTHAVSAKPGMFELAQGGTIFLDEIGDMSSDLQAKILKALQEKKIIRVGGTKFKTIDARVVAATNKDLKGMMKKGEFRQDLYYRLAGVELKVDPLKQRMQEIPLLANYFLYHYTQENNLKVSRISPQALKMLMAYDWPGNITELKNYISRAASMTNSKIIRPEDLPEDLQEYNTESFEQFPTIEDVERRHIIKALHRTSGNKRKSAQLLGISRDTMYKKIEKYAIALE